MAGSRELAWQKIGSQKEIQAINALSSVTQIVNGIKNHSLMTLQVFTLFGPGALKITMRFFKQRFEKCI